jgi:hypothetical protein
MTMPDFDFFWNACRHARHLRCVPCKPRGRSPPPHGNVFSPDGVRPFITLLLEKNAIGLEEILLIKYSTNALKKKKAYDFIRKPLFRWVWLDSNQRPRDYESLINMKLQ